MRTPLLLLLPSCLWLSAAVALRPKCCPWDHVLVQETASSSTARCLSATAEAAAAVVANRLDTNTTFEGCSQDDTDRAFRIVSMINSTGRPTYSKLLLRVRKWHSFQFQPEKLKVLKYSYFIRTYQRHFLHNLG